MAINVVPDKVIREFGHELSDDTAALISTVQVCCCKMERVQIQKCLADIITVVGVQIAQNIRISCHDCEFKGIRCQHLWIVLH